MLLVVSLVTFLTFLMLARDQAVGVAALFLITTAVVPLLASESASVAHGFIQSIADRWKRACGASDFCGSRLLPNTCTSRTSISIIPR